MKKISIIVLVIALSLASCNMERTADQVNVEISKTKNKIAQLSQELETLETELATFDQTETVATTKVTVMPVKMSQFEDFINLSGMVEAVNSAAIMPELSGTIEEVHVKEGQWVNKGSTLISLDSDVMQKSLAEIETGYELAKTMYDKQKELYDQGVGSEVQYLQTKNQKESLEKTMETLRTQMKMSTMTAPFAGRIEKIYFKTGETASPGRPIIDLVNTNELYINTEVSEAFLETVHKGDTAWLEFPNLSGKVATVPVAFVSQVINPQSRTFSIRLELTNTKGEIRPNMLVNIRLKVFDADDVLTVPTNLVRHDIRGSFVYLALPHDNTYTASKTIVKTGKSDGVVTIIEEGLKGGDLLISKGYNQVKDGSFLELINE